MHAKQSIIRNVERIFAKRSSKIFCMSEETRADCQRGRYEVGEARRFQEVLILLSGTGRSWRRMKEESPVYEDFRKREAKSASLVLLRKPWLDYISGHKT